jgi:hypothetical protein
MTGSTRNGLRKHIAFRIKHARGKITSFSNDRSERRVHQSGGLLIHDRNQTAPQNFESDGID